MTTWAASVVAVTAVLCACDRTEQRAFAALAKEANPTLAAARPVAGLIFDPTAADSDVAHACRESRAVLLKLYVAGFDRIGVRPEGAFSVSTLADLIMWDLTSYCRVSDGDPGGTAFCTEQCRILWTELAEAVEEVRGRAARQGVAITGLR